MKNRDNARTKYFVRQKLLGGLLVLLGVLSAFILEGDITMALIIVPLGLCVVFTKHMVLVDDYFFEHQEIHNDEEEEL